MPPQSAVPVYLPCEAPVFALLHGSARVLEPRTAVLICPPFGWDEICCYRSRREWAIHLAEAGYPTLRFDFPGAGDSCGSPREPRRLAAWTEAAAKAAAWMPGATGCERVAAIGIGLGGLVLCNAIAQGAGIDELVLWAVPARGAALVRELRAFAQIQQDGAESAAGERGGRSSPQEIAAGVSFSPPKPSRTSRRSTLRS